MATPSKTGISEFRKSANSGKSGPPGKSRNPENTDCNIYHSITGTQPIQKMEKGHWLYFCAVRNSFITFALVEKYLQWIRKSKIPEMHITILDDYQNIIKSLNSFKILEKQNVTVLHQGEKDPEKLAILLTGTEILVLTRERTKIDAQLLSYLPDLKLISQTGKISNHLNLEDCTKYGIAVAEGSGSPTAPAELTWALIMNTVRKIPQAIQAMKSGHWQTNIGETIEGKTLGIWGYGKIGKKIAQYAKVFGANIIVWGSEASRKKAMEDGFSQAKSKSEFFKTADIVTLHLRLNEATRGIVKQQDLMELKENAAFINTSRAELVETNALINTLKSGQKINVGIDVYDKEPIYDKDYELLGMDNVICTPHIGYVERNGYELYFGKAFDNVINFIQGHPTNIANPQVLQR